MSSPEPQHDALYEQLMSISHQAYLDQAYEVAYHTLCAAMYRARDLNNVHHLREVLQEADTQKRTLDRAHPEHPLSSSSASSRRHDSVYGSLQRHASTLIRLLET
ncbi:MAG: hypothetical protein JOZ18_11395 [Chloroflexi bacterium]|nr:hypothetical protein [Chloroflexota bacterium]